METSMFQDEVFRALGVQGGTVHQVVRAITRLRDIETKARRFGAEVAFADTVGNLNKRADGVRQAGARLHDSLLIVVG